MYLRAQVINQETGQAVAAVVASSTLVTPATLAKWAAAVATQADAAAGQKGLHGVQGTEDLASAALALTRLAGVKPGAGNHGTKRKGRCPVCGRVYPVNKTGKLAKHGKQYGNRDSGHCSGSARAPKAII